MAAMLGLVANYLTSKFRGTLMYTHLLVGRVSNGAASIGSDINYY